MALIRPILEKSQLFSGLEETELDRLAAQMRITPFKSGKPLFQKDDPSNGCYAVIEGAFKVVIISSEGEETLLAILGAGDIVGEMGLLDGEPRSASVLALRESKAAHLATRDFERVANDNPSIYRHMMRILSQRLRASNESFAARQMLPLNGRLARVLLRMSEEFGQALDDGRILIRQKITQADLARMTGSARENVNRQISEWRRKNVLSQISRYYCLENIDFFRDLAKL